MSNSKYRIQEKPLITGEKPREKKGYIRDFITNTWVNATPEEIEAVQIFAKQLVEDYNYPKSYIQTKPQYRVKQRPSGGKDFPVDIAVFSSNNHTNILLLNVRERIEKTVRNNWKIICVSPKRIWVYGLMEKKDYF